MNILITGSKGFIGTHLSRFLKQRGYGIVGVDRLDGREVQDIKEQNLKDVGCVIHLAAQVSVWNEDIEQIYRDNYEAFLHIFELCRRLGKRFIYASSSCSINITSDYGKSKQFNEMHAKFNPWPGCIGLRFHNVYGPEARKDTLLGRCLNENKIVLYNCGKNYRHFTYIEDVCKSIENAMFLPQGLYNVYNPLENSTLEFIQEVIKYRPELQLYIEESTRPLDKEKQIVDNNIQNLISPNDCITIEEGIRKVFIS